MEEIIKFINDSNNKIEKFAKYLDNVLSDSEKVIYDKIYLESIKANLEKISLQYNNYKKVINDFSISNEDQYEQYDDIIYAFESKLDILNDNIEKLLKVDEVFSYVHMIIYNNFIKK